MFDWCALNLFITSILQRWPGYIGIECDMVTWLPDMHSKKKKKQADTEQMTSLQKPKHQIYGNIK